MTRTINRVSISAAILLGLFLLAGGASAEQAKIGKKAPDFTLKDHNGKDVKLTDFKGKTVVLEWLNPGCPFVKRHYEAGTMVKLAKEYSKSRDVVWLALNSGAGATAADMKQFAEKHKLPYPILIDSDGEVGKAYGAKTTPHIFIIDKKGDLAYAGGIDNDPDGEKSADRVNYVKQALDELGGGKSVSKSETPSYGCGIKYKK